MAGTGQAHHAHTGLAGVGGHLQPQQREVIEDSRRVVVGVNEDGVDEDVLVVDGLRGGAGVPLPEPHLNRIIKYFPSHLRGSWPCYN